MDTVRAYLVVGKIHYNLPMKIFSRCVFVFVNFFLVVIIVMYRDFKVINIHLMDDPFWIWTCAQTFIMFFIR